jgi:hypothetical protein
VPQRIVTQVYRFRELTREAQNHAVAALMEARAGKGWTDAEARDIVTTMMCDLQAHLRSPGWTGDGYEIPGVTLTAWRTEHQPFIALDGVLTRDTAPALPWPDDDRISAVELASSDAGTNVGVHAGHGDDLADKVRALHQAMFDHVNHALDAGVEQAEWLVGEELTRERCETYDYTWLYLQDGTPYHTLPPEPVPESPGLATLSGPLASGQWRLEYLLGQQLPMTPREDEINQAAAFVPMTGPYLAAGSDGTLPCVEVGGVQVFVYVKGGVLRVSVTTDRAAGELLNPEGLVAYAFCVGGELVHRDGAPAAAGERDPDSPERTPS